jgi:hypothetical protein
MPPIEQALLLIDLPLTDSADFQRLSFGNRPGRACLGALQAFATEVLDTQINGLVISEGKVGGYAG